MENPEKIEIEGLKTIQKLCKFGADHNMEGRSFTEIVERMFGELAKAQAVPDTYTPIVLALEDVQSKIAKTSFLTIDAENENEVYVVDENEISAYIDESIKAQEPK